MTCATGITPVISTSRLEGLRAQGLTSILLLTINGGRLAALVKLEGDQQSWQSSMAGEVMAHEAHMACPTGSFDAELT